MTAVRAADVWQRAARRRVRQSRVKDVDLDRCEIVVRGGKGTREARRLLRLMGSQRGPLDPDTRYARAGRQGDWRAAARPSAGERTPHVAPRRGDTYDSGAPDRDD